MASEIESGRVPQHDPPPDARLTQPEVDERGDSVLARGDDADHVLPPTELDPYTPEPGARDLRRAALWFAIVVAIVVVAVVVTAAVR